MSALDDVLSRLDGVRRSGDGYVAQCAGHDDRHQSLSVAAGQNREVIFNCHKGCTPESIVIGLSLEPREILGARRNGTVVPIRASRAEARRPAVISREPWDVQGYRHTKLQYEDGSKSFFWEHLEAKTQQWKSGLPEGVRGEGLLYGAELLAALPDGTTLGFCEGEKATDALRAAGIPAVASVTGAAGTPSEAALRQLLRFNVVLWADNDAVGIGHMQRTAERLVSLGSTPRWVVWQDAPPKGDAADATLEERARLVSEAVICTPEFLSAATTHLIGAAETNSLFITAREFAATTPEQPEWIAPPYVARGAITEVAGKLKASGKTTWLQAMSRRVLDGTPFMGFPTTKTGVIYLTEQAGPSYRAGLARADLLDRDDFVILFWNRARGMDWPSIVRAAITEAQRREFGLVIVDTLSQFSGVTGDNENSAGAALDAMKPLQEATAEGLAVVVSRHERKGGGEVGESGRGSSAYSGAVDIVASIRRAEGQGHDSIRVIHALGRFDDTPAELVIDLVNGQYVALGTAQAVKALEAKTALLEQLPTTEDEAVTLAKIVELVADAKLKRTTVQEALAELETQNAVHRLGQGKRGDPYRYWKAWEIDSAEAPVVAAETNTDEKPRTFGDYFAVPDGFEFVPAPPDPTTWENYRPCCGTDGVVRNLPDGQKECLDCGAVSGGQE